MTTRATKILMVRAIRRPRLHRPQTQPVPVAAEVHRAHPAACRVIIRLVLIDQAAVLAVQAVAAGQALGQADLEIPAVQADQAAAAQGSRPADQQAA